jgi:outer membrane protein OmpA-like peptidoglycan-associated protein
MKLSCATVAVLAAVWASPAIAQRAGTIELGVFGRFTHFDPSLVFDNSLGVGGLIGVTVAPGLWLEGSAAYQPTSSPTIGDIGALPLYARVVYAAPAAPRAAVLLGAGYVHQTYRKNRTGWEDGASGLLGVRFNLADQVVGRVTAVADYFPSPLNEAPGIGDNWDFSIHAGVGLLLGSPRVQDEDHDGVVDAVDACPHTPRGEVVDSRGCVVPKDADGDGVVDANDRCPDTPAGERVDANGCTLPKDTDGDGVVDGVDQCPATRAGVQVDATGCPVDLDEDGVPNAADKCPNTPAGERVDAVGCTLPKDSDGDGVLDPADKCPATPVGQRVDAIGCPVLFTGVQRTLVLEGVNFETGSANLTDQSHNTLDRVAASLKAYPDLRVEIAGYTDSRGSSGVNLRLSQQRADAVRSYLVSQGVNPAQLRSRGYGAASPIASNTTAVGRARNRRVELHRLN